MVSLPEVPLPVKSETRPGGRPPIPVSWSTGVPLDQGCGGGISAALVSAWLPKRTRIELMADSSATSCIFHCLARRETQGREWRHPRPYRTNVRESRGKASFDVQTRFCRQVRNGGLLQPLRRLA